MPPRDYDDEQGLIDRPGGRKSGGNNKSINKLLPFFWFGAACCVTAGGVIGFLVLFFSTFQPVDCLDEAYLIVLGLVMMIVDLPGDPAFVHEFRHCIKKYAMVLSRIVGKGVTQTFLGCMTVASLWNNDISYFLAVVLGFFVVIVGILTIFWGVAKSRQLERVRFACHKSTQGGPDGGGGSTSRLFAQCAKGSHVMDKFQFADLANRTASMALEEDMLTMVFNAISQAPDTPVLTEEDIDDWIRAPGMTWL